MSNSTSLYYSIEQLVSNIKFFLVSIRVMVES